MTADPEPVPETPPDIGITVVEVIGLDEQIS